MTHQNGERPFRRHWQSWVLGNGQMKKTNALPYSPPTHCSPLPSYGTVFGSPSYQSHQSPQNPQRQWKPVTLDPEGLHKMKTTSHTTEFALWSNILCHHLLFHLEQKKTMSYVGVSRPSWLWWARPTRQYRVRFRVEAFFLSVRIFGIIQCLAVTF